MAKKILFIVLLFILIIAGSLVSMADEDNSAVINNDNTYVEDSSEAGGNVFDSFIGNSSTYEAAAEDAEDAVEEAYSTEAVIEKYGYLFYDEQVKSEIELVNINSEGIMQNGKSRDERDFIISVSVTDAIELDYDESLILMILIKKDDEYEFLAYPEESRAWFLTNVRFPFTGKDNPNQIRFVAFPKNSFNELQLDVNLQITDMEFFNITYWNKPNETYLNTQQSLNLLDDNVHESE